MCLPLTSLGSQTTIILNKLHQNITATNFFKMILNILVPKLSWTCVYGEWYRWTNFPAWVYTNLHVHLIMDLFGIKIFVSRQLIKWYQNIFKICTHKVFKCIHVFLTKKRCDVFLKWYLPLPTSSIFRASNSTLGSPDGLCLLFSTGQLQQRTALHRRPEGWYISAGIRYY